MVEVGTVLIMLLVMAVLVAEVIVHHHLPVEQETRLQHLHHKAVMVVVAEHLVAVVVAQVRLEQINQVVVLVGQVVMEPHPALPVLL
jgi:energy-converting hydrogenase Eha subunit C